MTPLEQAIMTIAVPALVIVSLFLLWFIVDRVRCHRNPSLDKIAEGWNIVAMCRDLPQGSYATSHEEFTSAMGAYIEAYQSGQVQAQDFSTRADLVSFVRKHIHT